MIVQHSIQEAAEGRVPGGCAATLGTFDGMHRGHQAILRELRIVAGHEGRRTVLVTFDPHPREVLLRNGERIGLLTTIDERLRLAAEQGVDTCVVLPFTRDLSLMGAADFFRGVLRDAIGARHVVVGENHAFGAGRKGDSGELRCLAEESGMQVTVVPSLRDGDRTISSTAVRRVLRDGDVETARTLLGRPYRLEGIVQRGDGIGQRLGFPTANIRPDSPGKLLPARGVYAVRVETAHRAERGICVAGGIMNIGVRPTVTDVGMETAEVHILDFDGDLYGFRIAVDFLVRLREERKFATQEALRARMEDDREEARKLFSILENTIPNKT
jgi:riboflavin kinase/FMN adenylyltransferase